MAGQPKTPADNPGSRGGQEAAPRTRQGGDTDAVDRDVLHTADYGGRRAPEDEEVAPTDVRQGGVSADDTGGGGRAPTAERDRDYDPDGDRTGR